MAGTVAVLLLALTACTTAPVQAMSDARQAVRAARQAGAPRYAPAEYAKALRWLDDAEFALQGGDYDRARTSAARAGDAARRAAARARLARPSAPSGGGGGNGGEDAAGRTIPTSLK